MQKTLRPAWVEVNLTQLRKNFELILKDKLTELRFTSVVKDQAYGHGMVEVAKTASEFGAHCIAVATVDEAVILRENGIRADILVFGERTAEELPVCVEHDLTVFANDRETINELARIARNALKEASVQVEIDTGLSRHGVRWTEALPVIEALTQSKALVWRGIMSHFAMSDELDKSFAMEQLARFNQVLAELQQRGIQVPLRHMCNTGGFLDLPQAHFDMVRMGILPLGVFPSQVCRRIPGLKPIMAVKTQIAVVRELEKGDYVGYSMRYQAQSPRRIAVLPLGYGDGYPRVRNQGAVLIHGQRAPVIGGNAMDAMMVDITDIPQANRWDEVVLMGSQGSEKIDVHEMAKLKGTVSYDAMTGWRSRVPRVYV